MIKNFDFVPPSSDASSPALDVPAPESTVRFHAREASATPYEQRPTWLVAIGGSAGSLSPLRVLLSGLAPGADVAYVAVVHFPESALPQLAEILGSTSALPIVPAAHGVSIETGHIYLVARGPYALCLQPETQQFSVCLSRGKRDASIANAMFESVATSHGDRAIGIALSGNEDCVAGLRKIREHGGIVLVQSPIEAIHPEAPEAALRWVDATSCAGVDELVLYLAELCRSSDSAQPLAKTW
ncbi:MAG: chemotaxis protein CheB [Myxococcota bacterium]